MQNYNLVAFIVSLAVVLAYLNHRFIRMQTTVALMSGAILISLTIIVLRHFGFIDLKNNLDLLIVNINFHDLLLNGMLSFLLFAGAMTVDFDLLKSNRWEIATLSTLSTIASCLLIAAGVYYVFPLIGIQVPFGFCLLFGALISPTDPIAVLATFKQLGAPGPLSNCVAGESLFNDGVGIVLFIVFYELVEAGHGIQLSHALWLFVREAVGGVVYGFIIGKLSCSMLRRTRDNQIAILITLAIVTGGYALANEFFSVSGPLAMVVCGLIVGTYLRNDAKSQTRVALDTFWNVIDEVFNTILFMLIGLELLTVTLSTPLIIAMIVTIPLVLLARLLTVATPLAFLQKLRNNVPYTIPILTWGGLRGGLAIALALSLPIGPDRQFLLTITYGVVAFAVIIQGLTIKPLVKRCNAELQRRVALAQNQADVSANQDR